MRNHIGVLGFHQQRTIEFLAEESQVPIAEVARLYGDQWAVFEDGARITSFLAILTARHVRELLRQHSAGKRPHQRWKFANRADKPAEKSP